MENKDLPSKQAQKQESRNSYLKFSGLAIQMVVTIGLMTYLGFKIDGWLELKIPVFLVVFSMSSLIGFIYILLRTTNKE